MKHWSEANVRSHMTRTHRVVLTALAAGGQVQWPKRYPCSAEARSAVMDTLERWGATCDGKITAFGRRLADDVTNVSTRE